ncbi:hypothetical protein TNCV_327741 [Trichonephila clavipes]|nr:hypothetical protein TNCV_327741 [Trichonephila clavipes]
MGGRGGGTLPSPKSRWANAVPLFVPIQQENPVTENKSSVTYPLFGIVWLAFQVLGLKGDRQNAPPLRFR